MSLYSFKRVCLLAVLLALPSRLAAQQSSESFSVPRAVFGSAGAAGLQAGDATAGVTAGQSSPPGNAGSADIEVSSGFWQPHRAALTPTPGPTPTPPCAGDCNGDLSVTVDELIQAVNMALGNLPVEQCRAADTNGDGQVTVDEIVAAVSVALNGCG